MERKQEKRIWAHNNRQQKERNPQNRCGTFVGPIPEGMEVCHRCDNPCCVNPEHLFVGTRQDNVDDREAKGRNHPPKDSRNGRAKLSEADVISARWEKIHKNISYQKLADKYGVSKRTMQDAINGKHWAHLIMPEPPEEVE